MPTHHHCLGPQQEPASSAKKPAAKPKPKPAAAKAASKAAAGEGEGGKVKRERKVFELPGQTRDTPEEVRCCCR